MHFSDCVLVVQKRRAEDRGAVEGLVAGNALLLSSRCGGSRLKGCSVATCGLRTVNATGNANETTRHKAGCFHLPVKRPL
jgi:hypothetical protein